VNVHVGKIELKLISSGSASDLLNSGETSTSDVLISMQKHEKGYWTCVVNNIQPGRRYKYRLNDEIDRPDPASNYQPEGVHGASCVIDHTGFQWDDNEWKGIQLTKFVFYELHVGTFTPEGTFEAVIPRLKELKSIGITAIELMPVAQFPGTRNWGYDGTYPFAAQNSYGGVDGLKKLVQACHNEGLAVILDVVYNHFGPEGCYFNDYGPYFTDEYKTPWGRAINYDQAYSDEVRNFFFENALYWLKDFHIDGLRLDAVHSIYDFSAKHFLSELSERIDEVYKTDGRKRYLIAESDLNDSRLVHLKKNGGYEIDAQWSDDFHHALHSLLTGEKKGYYMDFGKTEHLAEALKNNFVYSGKYSQYRKKRHGNSTEGLPSYRFTIFTQNHDQIGNRAFGERLSQLVPFEALKLAAGTMIFSPYIPLLFMGEEYGEDSPYQYFVSHTDDNLVNAVREGRRSEFGSFDWSEEVPDPQSEETHLRSVLNWDKRKEDKYKILLDFYKMLFKLRKKIPSLTNFDMEDMKVTFSEEEKIIILNRWKRENSTISIMNFNNKEIESGLTIPMGRWLKVLDSASEKWLGGGSAMPDYLTNDNNFVMREYSLSLYEKENI
jgi:maltooligosyltrehalose trehalohydrolase